MGAANSAHWFHPWLYTCSVQTADPNWFWLLSLPLSSELGFPLYESTADGRATAHQLYCFAIEVGFGANGLYSFPSRSLDTMLKCTVTGKFYAAPTFLSTGLSSLRVHRSWESRHRWAYSLGVGEVWWMPPWPLPAAWGPLFLQNPRKNTPFLALVLFFFKNPKKNSQGQPFMIVVWPQFFFH